MLAISNAAVTTFIPIQSSNVDVRRSGAEFSYNIEHSKGVALIQNPSPIFAKLRSIMDPSNEDVQKKESGQLESGSLKTKQSSEEPKSGEIQLLPLDSNQLRGAKGSNLPVESNIKPEALTYILDGTIPSLPIVYSNVGYQPLLIYQNGQVVEQQRFV